MFRETTQMKDASVALQNAFVNGNAEEVQSAFENFGSAIAASVQADYESANGDREILAQRGFRQLTSKERQYYEAIIEAGKSSKTVQTMNGLISVMETPATIIEDVFKDLQEDHPFLGRLNFVSVAYMTKWILNDASIDTAVWGDVGDAVSKQISGAFKVVSVNQNKLSAYALIEKDMLELGPTFLDGYIRTLLKAALLKALESAVVSGNGHKCPIGLDRDIHEGVQVSTTTGYPRKSKITVKSFRPAEYGALLANLAVTEKGNQRKFTQATLLCNMTDYLTKIMPATTVLGANGLYVHDLFPFPTEVFVVDGLSTGDAIMCLPDEYFLGIGSSKEGVIEFSDDVKFLEDQRAFKIKMFGAGMAADNTCAILLDISGLSPAYMTVLTSSLEEEEGTLGTLTVTSVAGTAVGDTKITVSPAKAATSNAYKYKVKTEAEDVQLGDNVRNWNTWDGSADITAENGKKITVVECNASYQALKAGNATVVAAAAAANDDPEE